MRIALYARVSKAIEQNPENQLIALREWAGRAGVEVVGKIWDDDVQEQINSWKKIRRGK